MTFAGTRFNQNIFNKFDSLLIHIALRQFWLDELPSWCFDTSDMAFTDRLTLLKICAFYGHDKTLDWLLKEIEKWLRRNDDTDESANRQFYELSCRNAYEGAIEFGEVKCVKVLMGNCKIEDYGMGINSITIINSLRTVCQKGYTELLELLLKPDHRYPSFHLLILDAAYGGSVEIMRRLNEASQSRWSVQEGRFTEVLKVAAEEGHVDIVNYLLDNFNDNVDSESLNAAMKAACGMGHAKVVKVLSKFDQIDMNAYGITALQSAALLGDPEFMQTLVDCGKVDVTIDQNAALRYSCRNGFLGVVKVLLKVKGVDPGACDNEAFRSACKNGHVGIVNVLLRTGCVDPTACDNEGFREACKNGHKEVVKVLLRVPNVDPGACDNEGLRMGCRHNRNEVVRVLLRTVGSRGVDMSACGYEAVKFACENRNWAIVKMLVAKGEKDVVAVAMEMAEERGLKDVADMIKNSA
ncbi:hypothetical protein HDU76_000944 [Blyttiomyces sp. JEL0837]|nr:hypothetical protein HDU76_000944 [Blyttiomyces sp. JEL0837]